MGITRLNIEIYSHTDSFKNRFRCFAFTDSYLKFQYNSRYDFCEVCIFKSSKTCYRVMMFKSHLSIDRIADYKSFRTISDMCVYLETLSKSLM